MFDQPFLRAIVVVDWDCLPYNPAWALRAMVGYDKFLFDRTPGYMDRFDHF